MAQIAAAGAHASYNGRWILSGSILDTQDRISMVVLSGQAELEARSRQDLGPTPSGAASGWLHVTLSLRLLLLVLKYHTMDALWSLWMMVRASKD